MYSSEFVSASKLYQIVSPTTKDVLLSTLRLCLSAWPRSVAISTEVKALLKLRFMGLVSTEYLRCPIPRPIPRFSTFLNRNR